MFNWINLLRDRSPLRKSEGLIFDIGMNNGNDTDFYLAKGFDVVAVEANPALFKAAKRKFSNALANGQLAILNEGIWNTDGELPFYENLDNDHWSSFDRDYGTRQGSRYRVHNIACHRIESLFDRFGTPHAMKIDVEGADKHTLAEMKHLNNRPDYISVEEYGIQTLSAVRELGYDRFAVAPQNDKSWCVPPKPPKEGRYAKRRFNGEDSGLFGRELPFEWLPYDSAYQQYCATVRNEVGNYIGRQNEWYDVHATFERFALEAYP